MYICICHAVTDTAIKAAVNDGVATFRELSSQTGCSTQCGSCVEKARRVLNDALQDMGKESAAVDLRVVASI